MQWTTVRLATALPPSELAASVFCLHQMAFLCHVPTCHQPLPKSRFTNKCCFAFSGLLFRCVSIYSSYSLREKVEAKKQFVPGGVAGEMIFNDDWF